jgi:hypothetical protein
MEIAEFFKECASLLRRDIVIPTQIEWFSASGLQSPDAT